MNNIKNLSLFGICLAFVVIALGAWTRLVDAGLGGLALNQTSSLVKGLIPRRALTAGLCSVLIRKSPGSVNCPTLWGPILASIKRSSEAITQPTSFFVSPLSPASHASSSDFDSFSAIGFGGDDFVFAIFLAAGLSFCLPMTFCGPHEVCV